MCTKKEGQSHRVSSKQAKSIPPLGSEPLPCSYTNPWSVWLSHAARTGTPAGCGSQFVCDEWMKFGEQLSETVALCVDTPQTMLDQAQW